MSDARSIADTRLAKGEITAEEHAKITASLESTVSPPPPVPNFEKQHFESQRSDLNKAWTMLGSGVVVFLCIKFTVDEIVASGDPVRWGLVYIVYALCAVAVIAGIGGILSSKKQ